MKMRTIPLAITVLALAFSMSVVAGASAMGGGDSTTITPKCKKGKIWSKPKKKCVVIKKSNLLDDENVYQTGRDLAIRCRYEDAIIVLSYSNNNKDPRVLNYLGYSHRKAGRIDTGLGYYKAALRIDPDYTLVREYMGEAFLIKGDVSSARVQLSEIENRCGRDCKEYAALASEIEKYSQQ